MSPENSRENFTLCIQLYQEMPTFSGDVSQTLWNNQFVYTKTELLTLNAFIAAHGRWWDDDRRRSLDKEMFIASNFFLKDT